MQFLSLFREKHQKGPSVNHNRPLKMRSVIPFKIISDGESELIPMTDIHSDLYRTKTTSLGRPIQRLIL